MREQCSWQDWGGRRLGEVFFGGDKICRCLGFHQLWRWLDRGFRLRPSSNRDQSKFSSLQEHNGNKAIVTADNTVHRVENEGTIVINGKQEYSITLNSVFHVPSMKKNIFSLANVVDAGNFVLFSPRDVKFLWNIKELKADVIHTSKRVKNLFVLLASDSYIEKMSNNDNSHLWHAILGHLNLDKLKVMKN